MTSLSPIENKEELREQIVARLHILHGYDKGEVPLLDLQISTATDDLMAFIEQAVVKARKDEAVYILKNGKWINEDKGLYCFACNTVSHMNHYKNKVATLCAECGKDFAYYPMIAAQVFIKRRIAQLQDNQGASNE